MLVCIGVIVAGFWPSYFSVANAVPWQFHAHGVAASLWVLMVLAQSWTPHHGQLTLHRAVGKASLLLFPFLIGGLFAIIDVTALGFVSGDFIRTRFGAQFFIGLALAVAAYLVLFYRALKFRRKVWVHSGYMLATPLILFESPFSRVLGHWVPPLNTPDPSTMIPSIEWAMVPSLVLIAALWAVYRERAKPFLVAGIFIVAQMLTMGLLARNALLEAVLVEMAKLPSAAVVLTGMAIGAATSWAGWQAGKRPALMRGSAATA
jgi:hypothetical protein